MNRKTIALHRIFSLSSILLIAGCGLSGPAHEAPIPGAAAVVDMGFMSFSPGTINVKVGQTVEWRNTSIITHNVTDSPGSAASPGDAAFPAGAIAFSSGDIPAGKIFAYKFTVPGTYHYFCTHHESDGMTGIVVVAPAS